MPTSLVKPISTSEAGIIFNRSQNWVAPGGFGIRAIAFDAEGKNPYYFGDYVDEMGARRDLDGQNIRKYKLFDVLAREVYSSF